MIPAKAKEKNNWQEWHYGVQASPDVLLEEGRAIPVIPRTVCESTGLFCKGRLVYENDWLAVKDNDGEVHKFLVALHEKEFRAYEDEDVSYVLANVLACEDCKVAGNLYD